MKILTHYLKQCGRCYYCQVVLWNAEKQTLIPCNIDHKKPKSKGGKNTDDNICLSCIPCNSLKGTMSEEEFRPVLELCLEKGFTMQDFKEYTRYLELKKKFEDDGDYRIDNP